MEFCHYLQWEQCWGFRLQMLSGKTRVYFSDLYRTDWFWHFNLQFTILLCLSVGTLQQKSPSSQNSQELLKKSNSTKLHVLFLKLFIIFQAFQLLSNFSLRLHLALTSQFSSTIEAEM